MSFIVKLSFQSQCVLTDDDLATMRIQSMMQFQAIGSRQKQEVVQKKKRRKKKKRIRKYAVSDANQITRTGTSLDVQRYLEYARLIVKNSKKQAALDSNNYMTWKMKLKEWSFQGWAYLRKKFRKNGN